LNIEKKIIMMKPVSVTRHTTRESNLRDEALLLLDKRGTLLDIAREVSRLMQASSIPGVVVGGIAVVLHGFVRTTNDIDIFLQPPLEPLADLLTANNFTFDQGKKEFVKNDVPVHLVLPDQVGTLQNEAVEIEGITTVTLVDLINMKLRNGSKNLLRAQDLADVIGLIRHRQLTSSFARHLDGELRPAFRKFVRMIEQETAGK
jgi:hypothetical protein